MFICIHHQRHRVGQQQNATTARPERAHSRSYPLFFGFPSRSRRKICQIQAIFRIVQRGQRRDLPDVEPLAVFRPTTGRYTGERCFTTTNLIAKFMQKAAATVLNLKAKDKALARWTTHSMRETACKLLHCQVFPNTYIRTRLR